MSTIFVDIRFFRVYHVVSCPTNKRDESARSMLETGFTFLENIEMVLGDRLRLLRKQKHLQQSDIRTRTGLSRSYISSVEHCHTVPNIETLEIFACALEVPLHRLFYEGEEPPELSNLPKRKSADDIVWGTKPRRCGIIACSQ